MFSKRSRQDVIHDELEMGGQDSLFLDASVLIEASGPKKSRWDDAIGIKSSPGGGVPAMQEMISGGSAHGVMPHDEPMPGGGPTEDPKPDGPIGDPLVTEFVDKFGEPPEHPVMETNTSSFWEELTNADNSGANQGKRYDAAMVKWEADILAWNREATAWNAARGTKIPLSDTGDRRGNFAKWAGIYEDVSGHTLNEGQDSEGYWHDYNAQRTEEADATKGTVQNPFIKEYWAAENWDPHNTRWDGAGWDDWAARVREGDPAAIMGVVDIVLNATMLPGLGSLAFKAARSAAMAATRSAARAGLSRAATMKHVRAAVQRAAGNGPRPPRPGSAAAHAAAAGRKGSVRYNMAVRGGRTGFSSTAVKATTHTAAVKRAPRLGSVKSGMVQREILANERIIKRAKHFFGKRARATARANRGAAQRLYDKHIYDRAMKPLEGAKTELLKMRAEQARAPFRLGWRNGRLGNMRSVAEREAAKAARAPGTPAARRRAELAARMNLAIPEAEPVAHGADLVGHRAVRAGRVRRAGPAGRGTAAKPATPATHLRTSPALPARRVADPALVRAQTQWMRQQEGAAAVAAESAVKRLARFAREVVPRAKYQRGMREARATHNKNIGDASFSTPPARRGPNGTPDTAGAIEREFAQGIGADMTAAERMPHHADTVTFNPRLAHRALAQGRAVEQLPRGTPSPFRATGNTEVARVYGGPRSAGKAELAQVYGELTPAERTAKALAHMDALEAEVIAIEARAAKATNEAANLANPGRNRGIDAHMPGSTAEEKAATIRYLAAEHAHELAVQAEERAALATPTQFFTPAGETPAARAATPAARAATPAERNVARRVSFASPEAPAFVPVEGAETSHLRALLNEATDASLNNMLRPSPAAKEAANLAHARYTAAHTEHHNLGKWL